MQGKPPEYTPSQLENLKFETGQPLGTGSTEKEETSIIIHPDYEVDQPQTAKCYQIQLENSELVEVASTTSELSATEPETESSTSKPASEFITQTPGCPHSPRVKLRIIDNHPLGLISIEEITDTE